MYVLHIRFVLHAPQIFKEDSDTDEDMPWKMQRAPDEKQDPSEKIKVTPLATPPSHQEWLRHQALHVPYARWCKTCVKTRGKERKHGRVTPEKLGETPLVELDFSFIKMQEQEKARPILVGCHVQSAGGLAVQLKTKSPSDPRAARAVGQD